MDYDIKSLKIIFSSDFELLESIFSPKNFERLQFYLLVQASAVNPDVRVLSVSPR